MKNEMYCVFVTSYLLRRIVLPCIRTQHMQRGGTAFFDGSHLMTLTFPPDLLTMAVSLKVQVIT